MFRSACCTPTGRHQVTYVLLYSRTELLHHYYYYIIIIIIIDIVIIY